MRAKRLTTPLYCEFIYLSDYRKQPCGTPGSPDHTLDIAATRKPAVGITKGEARVYRHPGDASLVVVCCLLCVLLSTSQTRQTKPPFPTSHSKSAAWLQSLRMTILPSCLPKRQKPAVHSTKAQVILLACPFSIFSLPFQISMLFSLPPGFWTHVSFHSAASPCLLSVVHYSQHSIETALSRGTRGLTMMGFNGTLQFPSSLLFEIWDIDCCHFY